MHPKDNLSRKPKLVGTARCAVTAPFKRGTCLIKRAHNRSIRSACWTRAGTAQRPVPTSKSAMHPKDNLFISFSYRYPCSRDEPYSLFQIFLAPQPRFAQGRGLQAASLSTISWDVLFRNVHVSVPRGSGVNVALRLREQRPRKQIPFSQGRPCPGPTN